MRKPKTAEQEVSQSEAEAMGMPQEVYLDLLEASIELEEILWSPKKGPTLAFRMGKSFLQSREKTKEIV